MGLAQLVRLLTCLILAFNRGEHGAHLFSFSRGEYGCYFFFLNKLLVFLLLALYQKNLFLSLDVENDPENFQLKPLFDVKLDVILRKP